MELWFQGIFNWDIIGNLQYASQWLAMLIIAVRQEKAASLINQIKSEVLPVKLCLWNGFEEKKKICKVVRGTDYTEVSGAFLITSFTYRAHNYII